MTGIVDEIERELAEQKASEREVVFVVGDVVRLKSGGFPMTAVSDEGHAWECVWHDADGWPHAEDYPKATLVTATVTALATYAEVPVDTPFDGCPPNWRDRRGL